MPSQTEQMLYPLVEGSEMRGWALFFVKSYIKSLLSFRCDCDVLSTSTALSLVSAVNTQCMKRSNAASKRNKDANKNKIKPYAKPDVLMRLTICPLLLVSQRPKIMSV